ncbi:hypothetical protein F2P79_004752 [Pimephales promelas]|nr:hypothetical protein F2P79_004752 [Pimephales promelas]
MKKDRAHNGAWQVGRRNSQRGRGNRRGSGARREEGITAEFSGATGREGTVGVCKGTRASAAVWVQHKKYPISLARQRVAQFQISVPNKGLHRILKALESSVQLADPLSEGIHSEVSLNTYKEHSENLLQTPSWTLQTQMSSDGILAVFLSLSLFDVFLSRSHLDA